MMGIIYLARNKVNGKGYIGQSVVSLKRRRSQHEGAALRGCVRSVHFYNAIRKYGVDAFEWLVVFDSVEECELDLLEVDAIQVYRTLAPSGYNLTTGGVSYRHTEESKLKIGLGHKGRIVSDATRLKNSEAARGRVRSQSAIEGQRLKIIEKWKDPEFRLMMSEIATGRKHSDETKAKMSKSQKGIAKPRRNSQ